MLLLALPTRVDCPCCVNSYISMLIRKNLIFAVSPNHSNGFVISNFLAPITVFHEIFHTLQQNNNYVRMILILRLTSETFLAEREVYVVSTSDLPLIRNYWTQVKLVLKTSNTFLTNRNSMLQVSTCM